MENKYHEGLTDGFLVGKADKVENGTEKSKREKRTEAQMFGDCRTTLQRVNYIGSRVKKLRIREAELLAMLTEEERELIKQYG